MAKRLAPVAAIALCLHLAPGCAEELAPLDYPSRTVSGRATYLGRALTSGWVEFEPIDGTVGVVRTARLGADGRFTARGVAVGRHRVKIVRTEPPLPDAYSSDESKLTCTVRAGAPNTLVLQLGDMQK